MGVQQIRLRITQRYNASAWFRLAALMVFVPFTVSCSLALGAIVRPAWLAATLGLTLMILSVFAFTWLVTARDEDDWP